jgi:hypothetical protein
MAAPARWRMNRTALLPVALLFLTMLPVAAVRPWTPLLLLVPVVVAAWVVRVGVDVDEEGITVRSLLAQRLVRWPELAGIRVAERGELWLVTTGRTEVRMPVLRARDLPRLAELSGGRISTGRPR